MINIKNFKDIEGYIIDEKLTEIKNNRKRLQKEITVTFMDVGSTTTRIFVMDKGLIRDEKHFNTGVKKVNKYIELKLFNYINKMNLSLCIVGIAGYGFEKIRNEILNNKPESPLSIESINHNGWISISLEKIKDIEPSFKTKRVGGEIIEFDVVYNFNKRIVSFVKNEVFIRIRGDSKMPWKAINATWETGLLNNLCDRENDIVIGIGGGSSQAFYWAEGKLKNIKDKKLGSDNFSDIDMPNKIFYFVEFVCNQAKQERNKDSCRVWIFETGMRRCNYEEDKIELYKNKYVSSINFNLVNNLHEKINFSFRFLSSRIELCGVIIDLAKTEDKIKEVKEYLDSCNFYRN